MGPSVPGLSRERRDRHAAYGAPMLTTDGCEFDGCEDIAYAHVVIPGQPPHDAFFCGNHGPYLQRALDQRPAPAIVVTRAAAGNGLASWCSLAAPWRLRSPLRCRSSTGDGAEYRSSNGR